MLKHGPVILIPKEYEIFIHNMELTLAMRSWSFSSKKETKENYQFDSLITIYIP